MIQKILTPDLSSILIKKWISREYVVNNFEVYSKYADRIIKQYETLEPEKVHQDWLEYIPAQGGLALDIAAGSGRDAAWLSTLNFEVFAVEPVDALRQQAIKIHSQSDITWINDTLPELKKVFSLSKCFDLILASAIWMHLTDQEQIVSMQNIARLIKPEGVVVITLRFGPSPDERIMYQLDTKAVIQTAKSVGFHTILKTDNKDLLKRKDVSWKTLILIKRKGQ